GYGVWLDCRRSARPALIHGDIRLSHNAGGVLERDVELVGHHLAKTCPGALAEIRFAHIECGRVVLMNHDPGVDFPGIGIGIRTRALTRAWIRASTLRLRDQGSGAR